MTTDNISIRPFSWTDLGELALLQAGAAPGGTVSTEGLERWLRQPGLQPERDCLIAESGGVPRGYGYVIVEAPIKRAVVLIEAPKHDDRRAVERTIIDAAIAHATALGLDVLHTDVPEDDADRQRALQAAGMRQLRTHLHLRRETPAKLAVAAGDGRTIRLAERGDVPALAALQNAAFTGSWGYCPNTADEIDYRVFDLPNDAPDGVVLLHEGAELVGYCWTHREALGEPGIVGMVGVLPERQGQGLGRIATAAGIDHLIDIGAAPIEITVDGENTPAVRLYEHLGFEQRWRSVWFEKKLG
jgi:mycothiol synthase